jgi:succinate dehydrogenase/fumarate reductase flavoprotein subunit
VKQAVALLQEGAAPRGGLPPESIRKRIQEIAGNGIACIRTEAGLQEAIGQLDALRREGLPALRIADQRDFVRSLELRNLCLTGQLVAAAARERTETRGQHRRDDHPKQDGAWLRHILLSRDGDGIRIATTPVGG